MELGSKRAMTPRASLNISLASEQGKERYYRKIITYDMVFWSETSLTSAAQTPTQAQKGSTITFRTFGACLRFFETF